MTRITKAPDVRRAEILNVAGMLFQTRGYALTSVDEITRSTGIAKGTFYYYFKSKEDVLDALSQQLVAEMAESSQAIADVPNMGAIEKLCAIVSEQNRIQAHGQNVVDNLHRPENHQLHERINVETVKALGPILASVAEQGNREGVFQVEDALSTLQFILAGSQFLMGAGSPNPEQSDAGSPSATEYGTFCWTAQEAAAHTRAMLILIERALGAAPGSLIVPLGASLQQPQT